MGDLSKTKWVRRRLARTGISMERRERAGQRRVRPLRSLRLWHHFRVTLASACVSAPARSGSIRTVPPFAPVAAARSNAQDARYGSRHDFRLSIFGRPPGQSALKGIIHEFGSYLGPGFAASDATFGPPRRSVPSANDPSVEDNDNDAESARTRSDRSAFTPISPAIADRPTRP